MKYLNCFTILSRQICFFMSLETTETKLFFCSRNSFLDNCFILFSKQLKIDLIIVCLPNYKLITTTANFLFKRKKSFTSTPKWCTSRTFIQSKWLILGYIYIYIFLPPWATETVITPGWRLMRTWYRTCFHTLYDEKLIYFYILLHIHIFC